MNINRNSRRLSSQSGRPSEGAPSTPVVAEGSEKEEIEMSSPYEPETLFESEQDDVTNTRLPPPPPPRPPVNNNSYEDDDE